MRRVVLVVFVCGWLWGGEKFAQCDEHQRTAEEEPVVELEGVVVTADRRPAPLKDTAEIIMVVTREEIRRMNPASTGEILESVVGLNIESGTGSGYPKRSIISINGLPPQYVLVLLNGQKLLTDHIHSGQNVDLIPPESIERIEVIKTAASAQYGSDAIGGVVNIITKRDTAAPQAKVIGSYGSNRSVNTGMGVSTPVGKGVHVTLFADWDRSDGVDVLAPANRLNNMGYGKVSLLNNVELEFNRHLSADLYFNFFHNKMDWQDSEVHSRLIMPKADLHWNASEDWQVTGTVEYSSWEADLSTELNELLTPRLFATWIAWEGRNQLTFGGDYSYNWFQRTGIEDTMTQWGYGVFAHDALKLSDSWSFSASLRMDHVDGLTPVFSPKASVLYRPIKELGIRLAVGRGFHAPTVQELYEKAYGHGGTALRFGNPELEPETSTAFSLSFEATPLKGLELFANGYFHLLDNFIAPKYEGAWSEDPTKDMWVRTNILRAWIYGGEVSGKWTPLPWLKIQAGYSYGGNRDESKDKQLQFHPGHSVFGKVDFRWLFATHYRLNLFARVTHRNGRSAWNWKPAGGEAQDNEEGYVTDLANYTLLDAGAEVTLWSRYSVFVNVTNILGEDIEHLDDALTRIDGAPLYRVGVRGTF